MITEIVSAAVTGVATVAAAPAVLSAVGFTAAGVTAGSLATVVQSAVYAGATTGLFSMLQSAGAAGIPYIAYTGLFSGGSAVGTVAGLVIRVAAHLKS